MNILVTGGAGFIGSAVVRYLIRETSHRVVVIDKLTYAGSLASLDPVSRSSRFAFERIDICDAPALAGAFLRYRPEGVIHLAAESHVDRSIDGPLTFVLTNVLGTATLMEAARAYWHTLDERRRRSFRFLHVSTDEVFGSLGAEGRFTEESRYDPSSPYAATKAGSDHIARAWHRTYGIPVIVSNTCNNYGPYQFPEKFIPNVIIKAIRGEPLPIYGTGANVRDWLFVEDHARALVNVLASGVPGQTYNIGANAERANIDVARAICSLLDERLPTSRHRPHGNLITLVADRPGHDLRYAIDPGKLERELGWRPLETMESGLRRTIDWYCENKTWWERISSQDYSGSRLGLAALPADPTISAGK